MTDQEDGITLLGVGFWPTFIYYFSCTALIVAIATSQGLNLSLTTPQPYRYGVLLGLLAGLIGAYFNRTTSLTVAFQDQQEFTVQLQQTLAEMGFEPQSEVVADLGADYLIYQRSALGRLLSGKIFVQMAPHSVTISSRAIHIQQLQQKLQE